MTDEARRSSAPAADRGHRRNRIGVIEGFYGPLWAPARRAEVLSWCAARGMGCYVWAPKDDPKHREQWRAPYEPAELEMLTAPALTGVRVGWAVGPGLSLNGTSPDDRAALHAKVDQVVEAGIDLVVLALDDLPTRPGMGPEHAEVAVRLHDHLHGRAELWMVPTEYTGTAPTPYLDALAARLPADVLVGWTGPFVVNDTISAADARARAASLGDRPPLLWENFPVNDAFMVDRLFMGPYQGREPALLGELSGVLANPMLQARASMLPLASVAAWCRGDDPVSAWRAEADALGWRVFAEAVEGRLPAAIGSQELDSWLEEASHCAVPGCEDEVRPWIDQVHLEAAVAQRAVRLWRAAQDPATASDRLVGLVADLVSSWRLAGSGQCTVFGPRRSLRPRIGQDAQGRWRCDAGFVELDANAIDVLVREALQAALTYK